MSDWQQKLAAGFTALGMLNSIAQSPTVEQAIPTNEPSSSQVQTTEAKCDPLANKSKEPSVEEKYGIPSEEMQQLGDSQDKSNDEKRDQIDKDITAENQPSISGSPPELTSCPVPSEDKYAQLQEPITASGVTDPELRVNTIPETNNNADLANQLRSETFSPSSQNEPQEVNSDSKNVA